MNKKFVKAAICAAVTVAFAVPALANPFADVPKNHWAYDAVGKLAADGIVDGYDDGTYKGDKTMTRYEMAQIVSKAMDKVSTVDQKVIVDKLAAEFGQELNDLGVKVDGIQKQMDDQVKISGDARVRFAAIEDANDATDFRARVTFNGKVSENLKFSARINSGNIDYKTATPSDGHGVRVDTANVTFDALGLKNTIGRQDLKLGTGTLFNTQANLISSQIGNLTLVAGNATTGGAEGRVYGAEYKTDLNGVKFTADFLKNEDLDLEWYAANTSFKVAEGVTAHAEYVKENESKDDAHAIGVTFNKIGLSATYKDVEANAYSPYSTMATQELYRAVNPGNAFKGMEYQYDKALDKNTNLNITHQDFKGMEARTAASVVVKF